jgi:hypothetical protein
LADSTNRSANAFRLGLLRGSAVPCSRLQTLRPASQGDRLSLIMRRRRLMGMPRTPPIDWPQRAPGVRLTFRRTYSSWAHDKGVPPKVVTRSWDTPRSTRRSTSARKCWTVRPATPRHASDLNWPELSRRQIRRRRQCIERNGSSGKIRTHNPTVNSVTQVFGFAGSRAGSSGGILLLLGVR